MKQTNYTTRIIEEKQFDQKDMIKINPNQLSAVLSMEYS